RILLVEDDTTLCAQLGKELTEAGYIVETAQNGIDAHHLGATEPFDAAILDLGLPQLDGLTVLKKWRAEGRSMPVLILTARDAWHEKVDGMDAGADDYLVSPFHRPALLPRLTALVRRTSGHASAELESGPAVLDTRSGKVSVDGHTLALTSHELRVLTHRMHIPPPLSSPTEPTE